MPKKKKAEKVKEKAKEKPKKVDIELPKFKLFGKWDVESIEVQDPGLKPYITLSPILVPFSAGRTQGKQFYKSKKNIVERLAGRLLVPGHKGKKHFRTSGYNTGKITTAFKIINKTFEIIQAKTKKNPVEVFIRAIEVGSPREGITTIEYGGMRYPKAADLAPQRRIDLALRWITQGAFTASAAAKNKRAIWETLAEEIIAAANGDSKSNCIQKKTELERQAAASR